MGPLILMLERASDHSATHRWKETVSLKLQNLRATEGETERVKARKSQKLASSLEIV